MPAFALALFSVIHRGFPLVKIDHAAILLGPVVQAGQGGDERRPKLSQSVLDPGRNLRKDPAIHHPGPLQLAQPFGQFLLGDRQHGPLQGSEANRTPGLMESEENVNRPLVGDQLDRPARRAISGRVGLFARTPFARERTSLQIMLSVVISILLVPTLPKGAYLPNDISLLVFTCRGMTVKRPLWGVGPVRGERTERGVSTSDERD